MSVKKGAVTVMTELKLYGPMVFLSVLLVTEAVGVAIYPTRQMAARSLLSSLAWHISTVSLLIQGLTTFIVVFLGVVYAADAAPTIRNVTFVTAWIGYAGLAISFIGMIARHKLGWLGWLRMILQTAMFAVASYVVMILSTASHA